jgi:hypothetical protein
MQGVLPTSVELIIVMVKQNLCLQKQIDFTQEQRTKIRKDIEQITNDDPDLKAKSDLLTS